MNLDLQFLVFVISISPAFKALESSKIFLCKCIVGLLHRGTRMPVTWCDQHHFCTFMVGGEKKTFHGIV